MKKELKGRVNQKFSVPFISQTEALGWGTGEKWCRGEGAVKDYSQYQQEIRPEGDTILTGEGGASTHQMDQRPFQIPYVRYRMSWEDDHRDQRLLETMKP